METPWKFKAEIIDGWGGDEWDYSIRDEEDNRLFDCGSRGNGERIVRCVNAHSDLVEALKGFMEYYGAYNDINDKRIEPYAAQAKKALLLVTT